MADKETTIMPGIVYTEGSERDYLLDLAFLIEGHMILPKGRIGPHNEEEARRILSSYVYGDNPIICGSKSHSVEEAPLPFLDRAFRSTYAEADRRDGVNNSIFGMNARSAYRRRRDELDKKRRSLGETRLRLSFQ